jgi:PAS domain S-box-containing protein
MKFADVVFLRPGRTVPAGHRTIPASADLFSLSDRQFAQLPESIAIVDDGGTSAAVVEKEFLNYLRRCCTPNQLMEILENAPVGVVAIDDESRIFYTNAAYTRVIGVPKQLVLGQYMRDLEPDAAILEVLSGRNAVIDRTVWVSSAKRHVRVNISPITRNGSLWGAVSFFTDITETTRLAGELSRVRSLADHFRKELESQSELPKGFADIIGRNPQFLRVLQTASIVAKTDASILILGEHGVGKEVLARAVHTASPRSNRPFIAVNCAAVPDSLLESELFGYEEGAFTGASRGGSMGKFELADGGVLFLDEIGDMPATMQAKLLRALQEKEIEKIGRKKTIAVDVRIIAATNRNLEEMVRSGRFREDLYYRLNVVSLTIPSLRDRLDDIGPLAADILDKCARKYAKHITPSPQLIDALRRHSWPGNVRELANVLEYSVIMCPDSLLLPEHLPPRLPRSSVQADGEVEPVRGTWKDVMHHTEKQLLQTALLDAKGNRSKAIRALGLSRKAFYARLRLYGLF